MPVNIGIEALSEKEKHTLRLIVRGHDAKSIARLERLSVHTINERLRDARRKLAVSSSREAARLLLDAEGSDVLAPIPDFSGDKQLREDSPSAPVDQALAPADSGQAFRRPSLMIGVPLMTIAIGLFALATLSQGTSISPPALPPAPAVATNIDAAVIDTARQWLAQLDQGNWAETYRGTGAAFQRLNTLAVWSQASEKARTPLGAMRSRTLLSQENLPAPPAGYEVVKFRTDFANRAGVLETVTLERENGGWRIVGIMLG